MPKEVKGNPRRTPPEPGAGHSDVQAWFEQLIPRLQPVVQALDKSIRAATPDLNYAVKYKRAFYRLSELGWIIEIAPYDVSVNVLFLGGASFDFPPPLGNTGQHPLRQDHLPGRGNAAEPGRLDPTSGTYTRLEMT